MFSDGTEGYDNCINCNDLFRTPLVLSKTNDQWFETLGPETSYSTKNGDTGSISFEKRLEMIDSNQFKDTPKIDRDAIYCGFCSAECRIKRLDKQNDRLSNELYHFKDLKDKYKSLIEKRKLLAEQLQKEQEVSIKLESAREHASDQLMDIKLHPYKYAFSHLFQYRIKRFFRTDSFIEFIAKYIIVLLVGYILFEVITRL